MTVETSDLLLDPYDYDFHEDPYPTYAWLRAHAPLYHNEDQDFWALSRYQSSWRRALAGRRMWLCPCWSPILQAGCLERRPAFSM